MRRAQAPATWAAEEEVPLRAAWRAPGMVLKMLLPGAARWTLLTPVFENQESWPLSLREVTETTLSES